MPLSLITLVNGQPIPLPSLQIVELYPEELWESIEFERPDAKNILRSIQRPVHWRGVWKLQLEVQRRLHEQLEGALELQLEIRRRLHEQLEGGDDLAFYKEGSAKIDCSNLEEEDKDCDGNEDQFLALKLNSSFQGFAEGMESSIQDGNN
ncbi:hypothetical protein GH714_035294 [Hevea brasiliensis]|uniref:Uncharacterized protein n=1 Tax=Hevea brasiliensis TaxID=3981 RepID=A0A6A6N4S6_HEVBR|nr:hypothetical protein GH714_035294 [Hevea brasiliensis]